MSISETVQQDAIAVLDKTIRAIKTHQFDELAHISNQTIHNSSINQDIVSTSISKIIFGIYKVEQASFLKSIPFPSDKLLLELQKLHKHLEHGQITLFEKAIEKTITLIEKIGSEFHLHNVINRAGVKKGGRLYEHGISIAQAAETMNVSQWELYDYVGKSSKEYIDTVDKRVKSRLAYTNKLFSK